MKKKIILFFLVLIIILGSIVGWYFFTNQKENNNYKLSLSEQQWIENNKNNVIDFYVPAEIDVFSYLGKGVFFDFLDSFTEYTDLKTNRIPYKLSNDKNRYNYAFEFSNTIAKNQIQVYKDNYVYLSHDKAIYNEVKNKKIGIVKDDKDIITNYLNDPTLEYEVFNTLDELKNAYAPIVSEGEEVIKTTDIDGIICLKSYSLDLMFEHDLTINYQFLNLNKNIVLTLNGDETLNNIFKKYYQKWSKDNFEASYNNHLISEYFNYNNVTEIEKNSLQEKKYIYGFVSNGAYDFIRNGNLNGINYQIIKSFASFANIDMDYHDEYLSYNELLNDFNKNKIDVFFNNGNYQNNEKGLQTKKVINSKIVILSNVKSPLIINNLSDLINKNVGVIKNSKIASHLANNGINIKTYNNMNKLLSSLGKDSIIAIDLDNYEYYKENELVNYKIVYQYNLDDNYNYIVNKENDAFYNLFNFYLEYSSINEIVISSYPDIYNVDKQINVLFILVVILSLILFLELLTHLRNLVKVLKTKTKHTLSKNDKLKYIDQLTSLKNRLYLNDSIEKWDNTAIYPQSIIIVNINDLTEINNNFGYEEGDKVILEAVNILIRTQLPNTEIIRTDGSEFLIYMIGYEEKQTVAYLRKLNKELKDISHGYGAVTGYSMITDGIKTVDDAINEATLDVKTNKELLDEENE